MSGIIPKSSVHALLNSTDIKPEIYKAPMPGAEHLNFSFYTLLQINVTEFNKLDADRSLSPKRKILRIIDRDELKKIAKKLNLKKFDNADYDELCKKDEKWRLYTKEKIESVIIPKKIKSYHKPETYKVHNNGERKALILLAEKEKEKIQNEEINEINLRVEQLRKKYNLK